MSGYNIILNNIKLLKNVSQVRFQNNEKVNISQKLNMSLAEKKLDLL